MGKGRKRAAYGTKREPNGQAQRVPPVSLAQAARLAGVNPLYGTPAGMACAQGEITRDEYDQAVRIAEVEAAYREALQCKSVASPALGGGSGGKPVDPESAAGEREAQRHAKAIQRYDAICASLRFRGAAIERATFRFALGGYCTAQERGWARVGLQQLADDARCGNRRRGG